MSKVDRILYQLFLVSVLDYSVISFQRSAIKMFQDLC